MDTGATSHMTASPSNLTSYFNMSNNRNIIVGSGHEIPIRGHGQAHLFWVLLVINITFCFWMITPTSYGLFRLSRNPKYFPYFYVLVPSFKLNLRRVPSVFNVIIGENSMMTHLDYSVTTMVWFFASPAPILLLKMERPKEKFEP